MREEKQELKELIKKARIIESKELRREVKVRKGEEVIKYEKDDKELEYKKENEKLIEDKYIIENKNINVDILYRLGLSKEQEEYWKENYSKCDLGRISSQHRDLYKIITIKGELLGNISGSLRHSLEEKNEYPAVGDWVAIESIDVDRVIIKGILPRKTTIARKVAGFKMEDQIIATNIDKIFITMSLNNDFNLRRIERYINIAWDSGATPIIILTKIDVCKDIKARLKELEEVSIGINILLVSSLTGEGIENVKNNISNNDSVVFIGSSGVGKSTLINKLMGMEIQDTSEIGNNDKGRHTTTYRELMILPEGGVIIDTPGMREIQLSQGDIESTFSDIEEIAKECYFSDCKHNTEPKCAIKDAIKKGIISIERLKSYEKQKRELYYANERRKSKERSRLKKIYGKNN